MAKTKQQLNTLIDEKIYENTSGAITAAVLNGVLKDVVDAQDALKFEPQLVNTLPAAEEAKERTIYLVPKSDGSGNNLKDEYIFISGSYEKIGDTTVQGADLNGSTVNIGGSQTSTVNLSGSYVNIGGSRTSTVSLSGAYTVNLSGSTVNLSGSTVNLSGSTVNLSGSVYVNGSPLSAGADLNGSTVNIGGSQTSTVNLSGSYVKVNGVIHAELSEIHAEFNKFVSSGLPVDAGSTTEYLLATEFEEGKGYRVKKISMSQLKEKLGIS